MSQISGPIASRAELADEEGLLSGQPAPKPEKRAKISSGEGRLAFYLIAPALLLLTAVVVYPIVSAIYHSLQSDSTNTLQANGLFATSTHYIGIHNYYLFLTGKCDVGGATQKCATGNVGGLWWIAVFNTVFYTLVTVTIETVLGMLFALMMNKAFRGRGLVRAVILVPWAIPTAVTAKLWVVIFDQNGVFNKIFGTNIAWTSAEWPGRFAIIIADVWKTTPFMALLILAGLQIIPAELYESAKVDGATAWQRFTKITLPLAKPAIAVAVIFRAMDVLRMYDLPAILTANAPNTDTVSTLVVKQLRVGVNAAASLSTMVFVMIFLFAFLLVKVLGANVVGSQARGVK